MSVTKRQIVKHATPRGMNQFDVGKAFDACLDAMIGLLIDDPDGHVELRKHFSIDRVRRASRMGRNPNTGEPLLIPERYVTQIRLADRHQQALNRRMSA